MNERRTELELLREFVRWGDQPAFTTVVRRHLDLVYATARRKVDDDGAAQVITQNVFGALARKAWLFAPDDSLPAWLHKTTLIEAKGWWRGELRRRRREKTAAELGTTMKAPDEQPALRALVPLLDEALLSLREKDRTALLLRYYESRPFREVGASLGVGEDAAQKRVASALQQLTQFFQRRGFRTATIAAAAGALQHTAVSAPIALVTSVTQAAMQMAPPAILGLAFLSRIASLTSLQKVVLCAALLAAPVGWQWHEARVAEVEAMRRQVEAETATAQKQRLQAAAQTRVRRQETARNAAVVPELEPAAMRAKEDSPVEKAYATRLTGIVHLPGFKAALLEVNYSVTNDLRKRQDGQWVVLTNCVSARTNFLFLTEGKADLEHLLGTHPEQEVVFEVSQINSENGEVRARENGREVVYAFESQDGRNTNIRLQGARWQDVMEILGVCLDRTILCHPVLKQRAISMAASARDKKDAADSMEMALKEIGISTFHDGDKFELVVPDELAQSATRIAEPVSQSATGIAEPVLVKTSNEVLPSGFINFTSLDLSQMLVVYGELIGHRLEQNEMLAGSSITLKTRTPLTKAEAIHAFDVLIGWHRLKVVLVDDHSFKVVRANER